MKETLERFIGVPTLLLICFCAIPVFVSPNFFNFSFVVPFTMGYAFCWLISIIYMFIGYLNNIDENIK